MTVIRNILLETGYTWHDSGQVSTDTSLFTITSENDLIIAITPQEGMVAATQDEQDGRGLLAIPPTAEYHVHLDKGHFGGPWEAVVPVAGGTQGRIAEEQGFLEEYLEYLPDRAAALMEYMGSFGTTFMRIQVNVDPVIGLQNYEIVNEVLHAHASRMSGELVAFPQHGTLATESQGLLTQALEAGAPILGALDPASIDGDIEASLTTTFNLASSFDREIDIHLHDGGETGIYTIQRIIDYTCDYEMRGRVAISHAFALGQTDDQTVASLAAGLAEQDIPIFTTQPLWHAASMGARAVPWRILADAGVRVQVTTDTINDHWSPFGSGDLLKHASRTAEIWWQVDEISLATTYQMVSNGVLPLSSSGEMLWPMIGDEATMILTDASCLSEAVARVPKERTMIIRGQMDSAPLARRPLNSSGKIRAMRLPV
ncbi:MAG: amidohydrolase family protein [Thermomicrobiales bacterium]|nr:amidohydrolase family protein [Thermomicrobiales bacterium]